MTPAIQRLRNGMRVTVNGNSCTPTLAQIIIALRIVNGEPVKLFAGDGELVINAIIHHLTK